MTTRIPHRELRNQSGEILRAVANGEEFIVTNRGRDMALISQVPDEPAKSRLPGLRLRPATKPLNLDDSKLITSSMTSETMLSGLRDD